MIPEKPDEMNDEEWELVIAMTHVDPSKRAELSHVIDTLKRFSMEDLDEPRQGGTTRCITCAALVFNHSRCCAQCGNQLGLKEESRSSCGPPGSPNTPMELNTDTSVRDLVNVLRSETIEEQESAVLLLLQVCIRDHKRHQILDENGVPILVDLVKNGRTHFLKVCALGCLCWSSELDSTPSDDEFEELRETIPAATNTECTSIVQALQDQSDRDKVKTVVYCTCTAGTIGRKPLLNAGIIPPLVKLLRNGNETITIWTMDALANMACDGDVNSAIVAEGAIPMLLEHLKNGSETQRGFAACVLGQLSVETASNSAMIVEGGAIPFLVGLLRAQTNIPKNFAAFALDGIAAVNDDYGLEIARNGGIQRLIKLLRSGTNTHKTHAASGLARLANQEENRQEIGRRGVITDFIALLRRGTEDQKESVAYALSYLALDTAFCTDMVEIGAISLLMALLRDGTEGQKEHALLTLGSLAEYHSQKIVDEGGVDPFLSLLRTGNKEQKMVAAQMLGWIAHSNEEQRREIISDEVIELLVELLRSGSHEEKDKGVFALCYLTDHGRTNTRALATRTIISLLVPFLREGRDEQKHFVVNAFGRLACIDTCKKMIVECGAIAPLVDLLKSDNTANKERAAIVLGRLAANDAANRDVMKRHGAVNLLKKFLRTGNRQQKRKVETALQSIGEESGRKQCRR
ncbi:hypothetical protein F441_10720 [Phytophthora nicotianae CJ01A1]|uniref:Protein kinase domain-containing protein n=2 Tax=Phytophthora nicotianae TaxID=4792 RepID=W2GNF6_PHYNI|nr:hypothetical protein L915_10537 [Phytophthora nicotianae]ETL37938.1 hypothetical protein L916_10426 [Phytophthora nicotianae]ETP14308.1 hypothetical protein F441_10720 [Phytophthora nicotianae CJ01A1]